MVNDVPIIVYGLRNVMGCPSSQLHTHIEHEKASMQLYSKSGGTWWSFIILGTLGGWNISNSKLPMWPRTHMMLIIIIYQHCMDTAPRRCGTRTHRFPAPKSFKAGTKCSQNSRNSVGSMGAFQQRLSCSGCAFQGLGSGYIYQVLIPFDHFLFPNIINCGLQ